MVIATGSYLVNDTLMKLATDGLPPYEVLFLRGCMALVWGLPLLFVLVRSTPRELLLRAPSSPPPSLLDRWV